MINELAVLEFHVMMWHRETVLRDVNLPFVIDIPIFSTKKTAAAIPVATVFTPVSPSSLQTRFQVLND